MTPTIFTINNKIDLNFKKEEQQGSKLKYIFLAREYNQTYISFSVALKNDEDYSQNNLWFSCYVGIPETQFAPGLDDQDLLYFKTYQGSNLSGYTKKEYILVPGSILEILYFKIPINSLRKSGSLMFYFGGQNIRKRKFEASWGDNEFPKNFPITTSQFLNFLNKKRKKRFKIIQKFFSSIFNFLKRLNNRFKNCINSKRNFVG